MKSSLSNLLTKISHQLTDTNDILKVSQYLNRSAVLDSCEENYVNKLQLVSELTTEQLQQNSTPDKPNLSLIEQNCWLKAQIHKLQSYQAIKDLAGDQVTTQDGSFDNYIQVESKKKTEDDIHYQTDETYLGGNQAVFLVENNNAEVQQAVLKIKAISQSACIIFAKQLSQAERNCIEIDEHTLTIDEQLIKKLFGPNYRCCSTNPKLAYFLKQLGELKTKVRDLLQLTKLPELIGFQHLQQDLQHLIDVYSDRVCDQSNQLIVQQTENILIGSQLEAANNQLQELYLQFEHAQQSFDGQLFVMNSENAVLQKQIIDIQQILAEKDNQIAELKQLIDMKNELLDELTCTNEQSPDLSIMVPMSCMFIDNEQVSCTQTYFTSPEKLDSNELQRYSKLMEEFNTIKQKYCQNDMLNSQIIESLKEQNNVLTNDNQLLKDRLQNSKLIAKIQYLTHKNIDLFDIIQHLKYIVSNSLKEIRCVLLQYREIFLLYESIVP